MKISTLCIKYVTAVDKLYMGHIQRLTATIQHLPHMRTRLTEDRDGNTDSTYVSLLFARHLARLS